MQESTSETRRCTKCGVEQPLEAFPRHRGNRKDGRHSQCSVCKNAAHIAWYQRNRDHAREYARTYWSDPTKAAEKRAYNRKRYHADPELVRWKRLKQKYGVTREQYEAMYETQAGKCAICGRHENPYGSGSRPLEVDHCHNTGRVRGLLCGNCNKAIALIPESALSQAALYLAAAEVSA